MIIVVSAFASVRCLSKRHRFLYLEKDVTILVSVVLKRMVWLFIKVHVLIQRRTGKAS